MTPHQTNGELAGNAPSAAATQATPLPAGGEGSSTPPDTTPLLFLRIRRGWTLKDLAARTGLSIATLSRLERGRSRITRRTLVRLEDGLELEPGEAEHLLKTS